MFLDIKSQIDSLIVRKMLANCVFDDSEKGMDITIKDYLRHSDWQLFGWHENGNIVGVCGFEAHTDWVEVLHIATDENARGQGVGGKMVAALQEQYKMNIEAETDDDAVKFYQKCGFDTTALNKYGVRRWACVLHINKV